MVQVLGFGAFAAWFCSALWPLRLDQNRSVTHLSRVQHSSNHSAPCKPSHHSSVSGSALIKSLSSMQTLTSLPGHSLRYAVQGMYSSPLPPSRVSLGSIGLYIMAKTLHHSLVVVREEFESMHGAAGTPTGEVKLSPVAIREFRV